MLQSRTSPRAAEELTDRVCAACGCAHEEHLAVLARAGWRVAASLKVRQGRVPRVQGGSMYTLRQATEADYAFLFHLLHASMKDYVTQTWGWDEVVQQTRFRERFEPAHVQIVLVDGRDVGALSVKQEPETLILGNLQLLPDAQKQGLGTAIIRTLLWQVGQLGVPVSLQVLKVNPARRLYERLGFTVIGETTTHYLMRTAPQAASPLSDFSG